MQQQSQQQQTTPIQSDQEQHEQDQQRDEQQSLVTQSPVSVVLTSPVSTLQSMQSQIVSIQQTVVPSSSAAITQAAGQLVQNVTTQAVTSQAVSISQLGVGTVLTTSSIPPNATVATISSSGLRTQRLVTGPGLQEMVFSPRTSSQNQTVVSVSGLTGQTVSQGQIQSGQLRLSMSGNQQVVTKGGISIGALTAAGKPIAQSAQIQFLRQNASRQQFKVLNTSQGNTVLQTVGGQVSVVNQAGAIIQSGLVSAGSNVGQTLQLQPAAGQKVSMSGNTSGTAGISSSVASVANVQITTSQATQAQRTQFMKQVAASKQQITRNVNETEMLLLKRQINQPQSQLQQSQQKTQIISQFAPTIQLQQAGTSGQQHITTLVKTSSAMATSGTNVGMTLAQIKPGQMKTTLPNTPNAVRQMQLQQIPMNQQQQRKPAGKMTQISQVTGNAASGGAGGNKTLGTTQLIVQNPKNLQPGTVTVQQIQQVMRHAQPSQIVLGKSVGRIIPVSVSSQSNARQTIQVSLFYDLKNGHF